VKRAFENDPQFRAALLQNLSPEGIAVVNDSNTEQIVSRDPRGQAQVLKVVDLSKTKPSLSKSQRSVARGDIDEIKQRLNNEKVRPDPLTVLGWSQEDILRAVQEFDPSLDWKKIRNSLTFPRVREYAPLFARYRSDAGERLS